MSSFKDKRLENRFIKIATAFSKAPASSIPKQSNDWSETKAAYRFFKNENVHEDDFFRSHQARTVERSKNYNYILALQDTSVISYNGHSHDNGMGRTRANAWGFFLHSTIAVAPDGNFLGVLSNDIWARTEKPREKKNGVIQYVEGVEKESERWCRSAENAAKLLGETTKIISIGDRECDFNEYYIRAHDCGAEFIVRQNISRKILNSSERSYEYVKQSPIRGSQEVVITNKNRVEGQRSKSFRVCDEFGKCQRETTLYYQYAPIEINAKVGEYYQKIKLSIVRIFEDSDDSNSIDWCLLTSLDIDSFEAAKLVSTYYAMRWRIELFFKVMKSGCKAEDCHLSTFNRMKKFVTLTTIIAWRISWLKYFSELNPDESATNILSDIETKILCLTNKHKGELTVSQSLLWIAKLGGHLNRKSDGPPGFQTIWLGMSRLYDLEQGYLLFQDS